MNRLEYTQADVTALHDIAAPWSVQAKLDSKGISRFAGVLPPGTSISLSGFIQAFMVGGENDPRVPILREIWREVEQNNYYRALMTIKPYRDAQAGFEKQLKRIVRGKGPYDELDKRLTYTYVTGDLIRHRLMISLPVRLEPDKPTARAAIDHIDGLLAVHRGTGIGPFFSDFELETRLRKFRAKLTTVVDSPRAENIMSPDNFFVFMLAQWFISTFERAMPVVISDLCLVVGYEPDRSTVERWVEKAREYSQGKREPA